MVAVFYDVCRSAEARCDVERFFPFLSACVRARVRFQVWIEFGRIKLPQGLHPNDLEEEWGKLILEMLEREKTLRPAVDRYKQNTLRSRTHFHKSINYCRDMVRLIKP